jgi:hypothetical protein
MFVGSTDQISAAVLQEAEEQSRGRGINLLARAVGQAQYGNDGALCRPEVFLPIESSQFNSDEFFKILLDCAGQVSLA